MAEYLANVRIFRDGVEYWSITDIALCPEEARDLRRVINQLAGSSLQMTEVDIVDSVGATSSKRKRVRWHLSMQDRVLLELSNGLSPEDALKRVVRGAPAAKRQLTETGKALRRSGLLAPRDWLLTPAGEARAKILKGERGNSSGEEDEQGHPTGILPMTGEMEPPTDPVEANRG